MVLSTGVPSSLVLLTFARPRYAPSPLLVTVPSPLSFQVAALLPLCGAMGVPQDSPS